MTSPARDYEMFEDEGAILGENPLEEEEEDGEELFNDNMEAWVHTPYQRPYYLIRDSPSHFRIFLLRSGKTIVILNLRKKPSST